MKRRNLYFMIDDAIKTKRKILRKEMPEHILYSGIQLEKEGLAKIQDYTKANLKKCKRDDIIITNRTRYVILMKLLGLKVILMNMNSNHDLWVGSSLKDKLLYRMYIYYYSLCDEIICYSGEQKKKLEDLNIKNIKVIPLGVHLDDLKKGKSGEEYILSSGIDKGRNHNYIKYHLDGFNLKMLGDENFLPYEKYIQVMNKSKCIVLNIDSSKRGASDLSGSTTCFEAAILKKPIIINEQGWLKELIRDNYYIYKNGKELKELLKKDLKFRERDYKHLTLKEFSRKLNKVIQQYQ